MPEIEHSQLTSPAPYLAMAFFCKRIDEDERGLKSFINSIDTLAFKLGDGESPSDSA